MDFSASLEKWAGRRPYDGLPRLARLGAWESATLACLTCVSPAVYSPIPLSSMPVPTAPTRQVPPSTPFYCCLTPHLRRFLPELAIPGICWDLRWIRWPSALEPSPSSKLPLFLPQSFSLLLLALPAPLFRPSCHNRLKPTLCSGFLWSW